MTRCSFKPAHIAVPAYSVDMPVRKVHYIERTNMITFTIYSKPYLSRRRKARQPDICWAHATTVRAWTHMWYCLLSHTSCSCQACPQTLKEQGPPSSSQGQTAPLALKLQNKDAAVRQPMKSNEVLKLMLHEVGMLHEIITERPSVQPARQV